VVIGTNIYGVITIMYGTNTINVTFYLLKVLHAPKKCRYCRIIQKIEGKYFIKSNYFLYFIPNNFFKKIFEGAHVPTLAL
jgi:hypothetical protein